MSWDKEAGWLTVMYHSLNMFLYMCVCLCICVFVCMFLCVCAHVYST